MKSRQLLAGSWFSHKLVSQAAHREQVFWFRRLVFYIAAQPDNEIVDGAGVCILVQVPDIFKNGLTRYRAAAVANQIPQQLQFHQCELKYLRGSAKLQLLKIHFLAIKPE